MLLGIIDYDNQNYTVEINIEVSSTFAVIRIMLGSGSSTKATIMYIMIGISTLLIVLWGIVSIIKYKISRENEGVAQLQALHQRAIRENLTMEDLDKNFPKTKFSELKTTFE
jgi:uncharacterized membrane protein YuzA (DUF378 family)